MSEYRFTGRERVTLELDGTFDPACLALPRRLVPDLTADGRARVRLFAFHVDDLRVTALPIVRASYPEVLWRIAAREGDRPVWWVCACDLAHVGARFAARRWVRYPVRAVGVTVTAERVRTGDHRGELAIEIASPGEATEAVEQRELRVGDGALVVPWGDDAAVARVAPARIERDSLSAATVGDAVRWAPFALVRHGRRHRCGVARTP